MRSRAQEFVLALVFLTRLPLAFLLPARVLPLGAALWAFPLAGAVIGTIAALPIWLLGPGLLPAALALTLALWLTAGLHEDGLADFADAGGGRDREDRLRIMRDPTIGSYGTAALVATYGLRLAALAMLGPAALIAAASVGRLAAVGLIIGLPPARGDGLGQGAGRPSARAVLVVLGLALSVIAVTLSPGAGLAVLLAGLLVCWLVGRRAVSLLGGQTGDVLGAGVLLTETAALVVLAVLAR